ncbi:MAG: protein arginine kinase [Clostridia bacterium]|nr:protein arginine kinase [Clostridia bacterium]MBQ3128815.1 protein arginine kinase [Clostridia bacterium]
MNKWYVENGTEGDIVISTRVRLARNLEDYPFPCRLTVKGKEKVCEEIKNAILADDNWGFGYTQMKDFTRAQAVSLAERHLISPEFASDRAGRALLLTDDEAVSIMLCEEDHIRLQVMMSGLALKEAYSVADKIDNIISSKLNYAYDDRIGYLTQCPTNLGTAMRASVMLHLPALTRCGQIGKLASTVSKLGLVIRGAYGEGSSPRGDIYQLSNQITLGISEESALNNLQSITLQLVAQERAAAEKLIENPIEEDRIFRAWGILKNARVLSGDEFMELSSLVRMGISNKAIDYDIAKLNELTIRVQPATINAAEGKELSSQQRDILRAIWVREALE